MGLDMYLSKKRYIGGDERKRLQITGLEPAVNVAKVECIVEEAAYWRKANAIHRWFVINVQGDRDECACFDVSREQLAALLDVVEQVVADHAKAAELLPTQTGFFFGGTAYDDGYFFDLEETRTMLSALLRKDDPDADFVYQASWWKSSSNGGAGTTSSRRRPSILGGSGWLFDVFPSASPALPSAIEAT